METLNSNQLRSLQLDILDYVSSFCDQNKIRYWITDGTLLGAIRHGGYIPWDDDIDIGMLRDDYDIFQKQFIDGGRYIFKSVEVDSRYPLQMGKVLDTYTDLYEPNREIGYKICVNIDVFVYDNIPEDFDSAMKMYDKRDFWKHWRTLQRSTNHRGNVFRKFAVSCFGKCLRIIPASFFAKRIVANSKSYNKQETKYVGDVTGDYRVQIDRSIFDDLIDVKFEGRAYKAPRQYDYFLTKIYGDYMKLPPENKRISTHGFEAYYIGNSNSSNIR